MTTTLTDTELKTKLLQFTAEGTLLYRRSSGRTPHEHYLQNYVATELAKLGFHVWAECHTNEVCSVFKIEKYADRDSRIDLLIWDRGPAGDPELRGPARAVIEFKINPADIGADIDRTAIFLAKVKARNPEMFGFVISAGYMHNSDKQPEIEIAQARKGAGDVRQFLTHPFDDVMPGRLQGHLYGIVIGVPVEPARTESQ